ncbi:hypothetical protein TD95_002432 [Thielaviopsis punctulata]|uniref:GST N-terminal domain-containing protein n=1 Tax=Thielaviopsis punctulata TaxID=72032 RepID=A0A0F4ZDF2_9PEZI|nr:hypothetical protein TD95_002432 [Thielaviopsis punctulata]
MTSTGKVTLFDLNSRPPRKTWSPNPWKTRLILNYKGIDYETEFLEYPEVKPRLEAHLPPGNDPHYPAPTYTIPTVKFPDGTYLMDSRVIATELEKRYPSRSLHLDSPYLPRLEALVSVLMSALCPVFIPTVPQAFLNDVSREYWERTRSAMFGMPCAELGRTKGGDAMWAAVAPDMQKVTALLQETDGVFFAGGEPGYADFVWVAFLLFFKGMGDDIWRNLMKAAGDEEPHLKLLEACKEWTARDDY